MNQEATQESYEISEQDLEQESFAGGSSSGGFATGTTCTSSGTYRASNKYMDSIIAIGSGDIFPLFVDGKKTTWYPLTSSLSTNKEGSFTSVKVEAGSI